MNNDCEEGACHDECNPASVGMNICFYDEMLKLGGEDNLDDETMDVYWDVYSACSSDINKFIDCQYDYCTDGFDIAYTREICNDAVCTNCVYMEASGAEYNVCELMDEEDLADGYEKFSCVNNQICLDYYQDSTCSTVDSGEGTECYDNNHCEEVGDGYYQLTTWYDGCGALAFEGASASAPLLVGLVLLMQVLAW